MALIDELLTKDGKSPDGPATTTINSATTGNSPAVPRWLIWLLLVGSALLVFVIGHGGQTAAPVTSPPSNYAAGTEFTPSFGTPANPLPTRQGPVVKINPPAVHKHKAAVGITSGPVGGQQVSASAQNTVTPQTQFGFQARHDALNAKLPAGKPASGTSVNIPPKLTKTTLIGGGGGGTGGGTVGGSKSGGTPPPATSTPVPPPAHTPPVAKVPAPAGPASDGVVAKNGTGPATQSPNVSDATSGSAGSLGTGSTGTNPNGSGGLNPNTTNPVTGVTAL